jgi:putative peptide zinc metalloprotease protein
LGPSADGAPHIDVHHRVPAIPALAGGVELAGVMPETGFADQQWLIRRNGRFIQVTELLYRVAEQLDGRQSIEEIAASLTASSRWIVDPEHVRQIIETKLAPLGLVEGWETAAARPPPRSPLKIQARVPLIPPPVLDRIASVLRLLYAPPALLVAIALSVAALTWLFAVHGVSNSLRTALYTPGALPVVLLLVIVSGLIHEFGHAAALRYGGGRVGVLGAGFYLVYPTFYTDTTDAYRLRRRDRVRTDLGGIYFHVLFSLILIGLYLLLRRELLLAVVVVIAFDIGYQLLPYARFDGYWTLADLTGIPDPLSQIGPFLRKRLTPRAKGTKLPELKPWVRRVFQVYIILALPTLVLLFVLIVLGLPGIVRVVWDAGRAQLTVISLARTLGVDELVVAAVAQLVVLGLSTLALAYLVVGLFRTPLTALWRWSRGSTFRSGLAVTAVLVGAAVLGAFWIPPLVGRMPSVPGMQTFDVSGRQHVTSPVTYEQVPPVGGDHDPVWQNCGFYGRPVRNENAVHSLEHGAVWITYRPGLGLGGTDLLRGLAAENDYVLVSPFPDLPSPVVASAWGYQLHVDSAADPRLRRFVGLFANGPQAPEANGPCSGGAG